MINQQMYIYKYVKSRIIDSSPTCCDHSCDYHQGVLQQEYNKCTIMVTGVTETRW